MKSIPVIIIVLFLTVAQFVNAQITPIETDTDNKKTTYSTQSYQNSNTIFKNQSYDLLQKLQKDLKLVDNIDLAFIKDCVLNDSNLQTTGTIFFVEYIVNEDGNVLGCKLINYGNKISLSSAEVECILTAAMDNNFSFSKVPNGVTEFYSKIMKRYIFK